MANPVARRRLPKNRGLEPYVKCNGGYYNYQHPVMRQKGLKPESFGKDKKAANAFAKDANAYFNGTADRLGSMLATAGRQDYTLSEVIDRFLAGFHLISSFRTAQEELDFMARTGRRKKGTWSFGTTRNAIATLSKIQKAEGYKSFSSLRVPDWKAILHGNFSGYGVRRSRDHMALVYDYAIAEGLTVDLNNYAEKVLVDRAPERQRKRIPDYATYVELHQQCPQWLQDAMDIALLSPLGRSEVVRLERKHISKEGGETLIKIFRQKTGVWFEIVCPPDLVKVINRCQERALKLGSPYLICTTFKHQGRKNNEAGTKLHRTQVLPSYLTHQFKRFTGRQFHEIRSLSGRILKEMNWTDEQIQEYYAHGKVSTTRIYLDDDKPKSVRVAPNFDLSSM